MSQLATSCAMYADNRAVWTLPPYRNRVPHHLTLVSCMCRVKLDTIILVPTLISWSASVLREALHALDELLVGEVLQNMFETDRGGVYPAHPCCSKSSPQVLPTK